MNELEYLKGNVAEIEISYKNNVKASERYRVRSSKDMYGLLMTLFNDGVIDHHEQMILICMDKANKVLGYNIISSGGVSGTVVDPKIIFQIALKMNASGIIISHNHPSGVTTPSDADIRITRKIKDSGAMLEIPVLDHLIVTSEGYYSFADEGMM